MRTGLVLVIKIYQACVSPYLGERCRFAPTCSEYAIQAITKYGPIKGGWMSLKRLLRCQPFCKGGYDPVP